MWNEDAGGASRCSNRPRRVMVYTITKHGTGNMETTRYSGLGKDLERLGARGWGINTGWDMYTIINVIRAGHGIGGGSNIYRMILILMKL